MKKTKQHNLTLSIKEYQCIENLKKNYENSRAVSIEALKIVQKKLGWVSSQAISEIARLLNISSSDVEEVATFYNQIFLSPVGKNIIRYCDSVVCYITGYEEIKNYLEQLLKIKSGETTYDKKFTLLPTCCLGNCDKAPSMMINEDIYSRVLLKNIKPILEKYK